ncbi:MAG TPA: nuclear transport factor 2 family protein [Candidatus Acidoferrum sp.]|nr:nuclear transport factor 2 family protein [Candidatus Acidoferrum sp.]
MGELEEFRTVFLARQTKAEEAMIHGDVQPRLALWSRREPVSLLGAWGPNKTGWAELERIFVWVAQRFGSTTQSDFRFDVEVAEVSADGQMAYTVGFERFNEILANGERKPWSVRVTHVYRREDGEWNIVHRHGDLAPVDESPPANGEKR